MTTYSTSLKLTLIGDGQESGTWGQTTNTNLGTLLEQAITGYVAINMADANVTLTSLNGTFDQARNAVIELTGTNSAVRDVIPPVAEKLYTIFNNTTGGYDVRVIGSTGTGVNVPAGTTMLVYCNGTNFVSGLSGTPGNFRVNGALSVAGATTLSSALTYGGVTLSNAVTGTGSMVLSASPTLTGTPIAPTAAAGTNTTQIATTAYVLANGIPSGGIMLWSGSIASIPSGWYLCNGSNGTPDLRDRFVVGAGSTYAVAATGGSANATLVSHTHTITDPGHTHPFTVYAKAADFQGASAITNGNDNESPGYAYNGNTSSNTTSITIDSTGSSATNANLPPYYALAYIMKA
jgi:hypothetical protein